MSMQTFVLSEQTAQSPIGPLVQQAASGAVEVRDNAGTLVAMVISPHDREALAYLEAYRDIELNRDKIIEALNRGGGVTTKELLESAERAANIRSA